MDSPPPVPPRPAPPAGPAIAPADLLEQLKAASKRLTEAAASIRAQIQADPGKEFGGDNFSFSAANRSKREHCDDIDLSLREAIAGEDLSILKCRDLGRMRRALVAPRPGMDMEGAVEIVGRRIRDLEASLAAARFDQLYDSKLKQADREVADALLKFAAKWKAREALARKANQDCGVALPVCPRIPRLTDQLGAIIRQVRNAKTAADLL